MCKNELLEDSEEFNSRLNKLLEVIPHEHIRELYHFQNDIRNELSVTRITIHRIYTKSLENQVCKGVYKSQTIREICDVEKLRIRNMYNLIKKIRKRRKE